jgi:hypothetical protein
MFTFIPLWVALDGSKGIGLGLFGVMAKTDKGNLLSLIFAKNEITINFIYVFRIKFRISLEMTP